ncbi:MarR family transcriptional regulator [Microcoleus sp. herbarium19]|uniref:MarR family winged helix-turn-helix transcriptional regulator n=1 Tax=unclassified Microcoleus TaxID=2642155 RepID=UPI002FD65A26
MPVTACLKHEVEVNPSSNHGTIVNFQQSYWAVNAAFETALSAYGLSGPQWDTLRILREHPGANGADIARIARVSPQAVATMLQRLEQAGLIVRRPPLRGRSVESYITPSGETLLREGDRVADEIEAKMLSDFSTEEKQHFNDYLQRCSANLKCDRASNKSNS